MTECDCQTAVEIVMPSEKLHFFIVYVPFKIINIGKIVPVKYTKCNIIFLSMFRIEIWFSTFLHMVLEQIKQLLL
jgi:hypothetical protein